jgi:hypothetical protein
LKLADLWKEDESLLGFGESVLGKAGPYVFE